jgi:solute carrier family 25 S-adenosylmethionine transporter 26
MFERLKLMVKKDRDERGVAKGTILESGIITALSAGAAGTVAAVVTTPIDVVKTRIMLSAVDDAVSKASQTDSKGLVDAMGQKAAKSKVTLRGAAREIKLLVRPAHRRRKSAWNIGQEIVNEKGMRGLWKGGALRGIWTFVGSGLYLGVYESGRVYLASRRGEDIDEAELL